MPGIPCDKDPAVAAMIRAIDAGSTDRLSLMALADAIEDAGGDPGPLRKLAAGNRRPKEFGESSYWYRASRSSDFHCGTPGHWLVGDAYRRVERVARGRVSNCRNFFDYDSYALACWDGAVAIYGG